MINYSISDGTWFSKIIKIVSGTQKTDEVLELIAKLEQDKTLRAIHIHVHEDCLFQILPSIKSTCKFRAYENNLYQYYKWLLTDVEDKVPPYATSTSGATTMILSPDELSVLLVYEADMWKPVTGGDYYANTSYDTALREAVEEVGVDIDLSFEPKVIGFWNIGGRCGGKINNMMTGYIVKAKSLDLKLDNFEITSAKWFKIEDLKHIMDMAKEDENIVGKYVFWSAVMDTNGSKYGYPYMLWLDKYLSGHFLTVHKKTDNVNFIY